MSSLIISKATKQVLVPFSSKIQALWPKAKTLEHNGTRYAILPHEPRTQIQLRAADIRVPPPILSHFDWAGGTPFEIQKTTAALATSNTRCYVLNDMGTGKTRASLWSWYYLHKSGVAGKLLVVAPLSTLKFVWQREVSLTLPGVKTAVLHGSKKKRLELLDSNASVFIVNHDGLKTILPELTQRTDINMLILDELAVYRNESLRAKHMRTFAQGFQWVIGMTGRPMPNAPTDVFNQCRILTPQQCPKYFRHAQSMLMTQVDRFRWAPKPEATNIAYSWMQPNVRYSLDDVVELPPAISRIIDVEMSAEQRSVYARVANEFAAMVKDQRITAANSAVAMGKLLQIGAGYVYSTNPEYVTLDSTARQETLLEILNEAPHKTIVFAPWRHLVEGLSALLTNLKEPIEHAVIHGDVTKREAIFNDFQNTPKYRVLLAHPGCVHHGLTLTAATTIVWYSPVTSLEVYEQANARIRRVGQKHKQLFLHLQSSAVERKVYAMLARKQRLQDAFLAMLKAGMNGEEQ